MLNDGVASTLRREEKKINSNRRKGKELEKDEKEKIIEMIVDGVGLTLRQRKEKKNSNRRKGKKKRNKGITKKIDNVEGIKGKESKKMTDK